MVSDTATNRPASANEVLATLSEGNKETVDKENTFAEILRNKVKVYSIVGPQEGNGPSSLYFKRWSYGVSAELMPMALDIVGTVFSGISPVLSSGELSGESIASIIGDTDLISSIGKHMKNISKIIARTIVSHPDNNYAPSDIQKAVQYVEGLDPYDIIQIVKLLFSQNFGHLGKNELGLTLQKKSGVSEK